MPGIAGLVAVAFSSSSLWPAPVWGAAPSSAATVAAPAGISWLAAAAIATLYYLSQSAWLAGLGFWTLYRPLVGGTLVGLILGDPLAGLQVGASINLAYLGFIATGGTLPSDISLAGYLGTALALAGGLDTGAALALTVPVGVLGYWIYQLRMNLDVVFVHWAERLAARGDARGVALVNVVPAQALLFILSFVPCLFAVYYGPQTLALWLGQLPIWFMKGLDIAGALLPALGIALGLSWLWRGHNRIAFGVGFALAALTPVSLLVLGLLGAALAWGRLLWRARRGARPSPGAMTLPEPAPESNLSAMAAGACADGGDESGSSGMAPAATGVHRLRRHDLWAAFVNWLFFSHASYNYERMQGIGFAHAMVPVLRRLYPERDELAAALQRHLAFYNSEPNVGTLVVGIAAAMEEARACALQDASSSEEATGRNNVSPAAIVGAKAGLMGTVSGVGDTLIQGTLAPALLSVGIGLALQGSPWGPISYVLAITALIWGVGWFCMWQGYRVGLNWLLHGLRTGQWGEVVAAAELLGSGMLGALAARSLPLTPLLAPFAGLPVVARLAPLVACGLVLTFLWLLRQLRPAWLVAGTFVLSYLVGWWLSV